MSTYPKSPHEAVGGMLYFGRMLDKLRLHARGELEKDYQANMGRPKTADGVCCNFLRVNHEQLRERVLQGGSDEDILEWCYNKGRRLNEDDLRVWNGFASKLGWHDAASPLLARRKEELGIADRPDIQTMGQLFDFEEGRSK